MSAPTDQLLAELRDRQERLIESLDRLDRRITGICIELGGPRQPVTRAAELPARLVGLPEVRWPEPPLLSPVGLLVQTVISEVEAGMPAPHDAEALLDELGPWVGEGPAERQPGATEQPVARAIHADSSLVTGGAQPDLDGLTDLSPRSPTGSEEMGLVEPGSEPSADEHGEDESVRALLSSSSSNRERPFTEELVPAGRTASKAKDQLADVGDASSGETREPRGALDLADHPHEESETTRQLRYEEQAERGPRAPWQRLELPRAVLVRKYKHAPEFGVTERFCRIGLDRFAAAVREHVRRSESAHRIPWRGRECTVFPGPRHLVVASVDLRLITAHRATEEQLVHVRAYPEVWP